MKNVKIICRTSDSGHGIVFECGNCGKTIFVNSLCRRKQCIRCNAIFKKHIKVKYEKE